MARTGAPPTGHGRHYAVRQSCRRSPSPRPSRPAGRAICFTGLDDTVHHLETAEDQGRLISKLTTCLRPSVLVADEVGQPAAGTSQGEPGLPGDLEALREGLEPPDLGVGR
ncbi:ATP-binding protein [Streptomyces sp. NPDC047706]|uniref:ATP-binding protein n=1 Tax=Streptomyces sp. NPDC047706 TaxID=3365486 RepID=UPI00371A4712